MSEQSTQAKSKPTPDKPNEAQEKGVERSGDAASDSAKKWDIIDEHAWESFPASDAPSSWAGRDIAPEEQEKQADKGGAKTKKQQS